MEFYSEKIKGAGCNNSKEQDGKKSSPARFLFTAYVVVISKQGGKILKIIKRAGSNKSEQDGKNCENN